MCAGSPFGPVPDRKPSLKKEQNLRAKLIIKNAMSTDLEDWFCVNDLSHVIKREDWDNCELRVYARHQTMLDLFDKHKSKATFFVLGWIAETPSELIREIESKGQAIAAHGYDRLLLAGNHDNIEFNEESREGTRGD